MLDEGEEGESQILGGMGLGEGEGEKDVSDQIENQDQLEDAKPAGQEKEEEEKDCKVHISYEINFLSAMIKTRNVFAT